MRRIHTKRSHGIVRSSGLAGGILAIVLSGTMFVFPLYADDIDTSEANFYAWGENIGWLNWGTTEGDVFVPSSTADGDLTGYVWGENVGWISLNCSNTSSCGSVDYGVERSQGNIIGYAWGENIGWLSFNCSNTSSCGSVDYGVTIATSNGEFAGYAWGENVGWVVLNCSTTSSCGTVDYKVIAIPSATPTPAADGGGGGFIPPIPTVSVNPSVSPPPPPVSPSPTASVTPSVSPPPGPPPTDGPSGPPDDSFPSMLPEIINRIVSGIDRIVDRIVGGIAENPVESGSGAAAVVALVPLLWIAVEVIQTKSAGAMLYHFLPVVGLKKKPRVWGTVYDAQTKKPIPFVRVQILDEAQRVLETRFADRDGRYGFLLSVSGTQERSRRVQMSASHGGFVFPSTKVGPGKDYMVYEKPYLGGVIEITGEAAITYDIPMDPIIVDGKRARPPFRAVIGSTTERILNVGFYIGLILVPWNMITNPSTPNLIVGAVFFGANIFRIFKVYRPYGEVTELASGTTVPFSLVTLHNEEGKRLTFSVSDEEGRYFISSQGDHDYQVRVHTPANIVPPRTVTEEIPRDSKEIKQGWIAKDMDV